MGNSQLQPAHFNKRRHHSKKRGGDGEAVEAAPAAQAPAAQAPAAPAEQAEVKSVAQKAEDKLKETQAAAINKVTETSDNAKKAVTGALQNLLGKANEAVGNAPAAEAAPAVGGGRRKRTKRSTHKRRTHKRSTHKRTKRRTTKRRIAKRK